MNIKKINTNGIQNIELLEGSTEWYWGSDYCHGDLYEAEQLFQNHHAVKGNRLIFVKYPEGIVEEPIMRQDGQYFGYPIFDNGAINILAVDFHNNQIKIIRYDVFTKELTTLAMIDKTTIKDCYNLLLRTSPVFLSRDGDDGNYEIIWPEKMQFKVEENEMIYQRDGNILFSSKWIENSEYLEETILRQYPTGEIVDRMRGLMILMPDHQRWIVG